VHRFEQAGKRFGRRPARLRTRHGRIISLPSRLS
jgi:hypothetical protein